MQKGSLCICILANYLMAIRVCIDIGLQIIILDMSRSILSPYFWRNLSGASQWLNFRHHYWCCPFILGTIHYWYKFWPSDDLRTICSFTVMMAEKAKKAGGFLEVLLGPTCSLDSLNVSIMKSLQSIYFKWICLLQTITTAQFS